MEPINLDQFKADLAAKRGITITAGDKTFVIRPPELLTDDEYAQAMPLLTSDEPGSEVELMRIIIDDYDGFVAAGGSAMIAAAMLKQQGDEFSAKDGVPAGESGAS